MYNIKLPEMGAVSPIYKHIAGINKHNYGDRKDGKED